MAGFSNTLTLPPLVFLFFCSLLSVQPSPAEKLTVLLIFDTAMEQTKEKKKGGRGGMGCFAWDGEAAPYRRPVICGGVKHLAGLFR